MKSDCSSYIINVVDVRLAMGLFGLQLGQNVVCHSRHCARKNWRG